MSKEQNDDAVQQQFKTKKAHAVRQSQCQSTKGQEGVVRAMLGYTSMKGALPSHPTEPAVPEAALPDNPFVPTGCQVTSHKRVWGRAGK